MNWYIGQKVVSLIDNLYFKKGDVFTIIHVRVTSCKCGYATIYVGHKMDFEEVLCYNCKTSVTVCKGSPFYFSETCFAPIEEHPEMSEYTADELLEELEPITA